MLAIMCSQEGRGTKYIPPFLSLLFNNSYCAGPFIKVYIRYITTSRYTISGIYILFIYFRNNQHSPSGTRGPGGVGYIVQEKRVK